MLLKNYNKALKDIYDHVGFVEDWVVYPIEDSTDYIYNYNNDEVWYIDKKHFYSGNINDNLYSNEIYEQRFYNKWIYVGEEYTLMIVDTRVDGNKFFQIFKNCNRVEDFYYEY